jgi:hypothetical protein
MYASLDSGATLQGRNAVSHADTHGVAQRLMLLANAKSGGIVHIPSLLVVTP